MGSPERYELLFIASESCTSAAPGLCAMADQLNSNEQIRMKKHRILYLKNDKKIFALFSATAVETIAIERCTSAARPSYYE
jgi:DNA-binding transcriptional regulator WhiA